MATFHNEAKPGDIAGCVLMPGDPVRARYIAEYYLSDVICYNQVRGMSGYTGYYKGKRFSVQGSGMGIPSMGIYAHELYQEFGVETIIRVGTAGAIDSRLKLGEVVFAMGCCTNSNFAAQYQLPGDFAPLADYLLLERAVNYARTGNIPYWVGNVYSSDVFYEDIPVKGEWSKMGVLAQEMETLSLYCTAARAGKKALGILTVGSSLHCGETLTNEERERSLDAMIITALEIGEESA